MCVKLHSKTPIYRIKGVGEGGLQFLKWDLSTRTLKQNSLDPNPRSGFIVVSLELYTTRSLKRLNRVSLVARVNVITI